MKVLLVHNHYRTEAPSGEDLIFDRELGLLREQPGWEVLLHSRFNDDLEALTWPGLLKVALRAPWNRAELEKVRNLIVRYRPDIMHVHGTWPQISPAVFHAAAGTTTAVVRTLHNYRTVCANGLLLREGKPCLKCIDARFAAPALLHRCYRDSLQATLPAAASIALHRLIGTWVTQVDAFIAFTQFQRDLMVRAGIPAERIHVKPNWIEMPAQPPLPWHMRENRVVFVGRLTPEKGVVVLIEAWKLLGANAPRLEIIGDGSEFERIGREVQDNHLRVTMRGRLHQDDVMAHLRSASLAVVPSICFEGFGLTVLEAMAMGVPILASDLGSLPSIIRHGQDGEVFEAGNAAKLAKAVQSLLSNPRRLEEMGRTARLRFEANYTAPAHLQAVCDVYASAIAHRRATLDARWRHDSRQKRHPEMMDGVLFSPARSGPDFDHTQTDRRSQ